MKDIIKNRLFFIIMVLVGLLITFAFINGQIIHPKNSFCKATVYYEFIYEDTVINYALHHRIFIYQDGSGYDNLRGTVVVQGETFTIARTLVFKHDTKLNKNDREMTITSENKLVNDTMPDDLTKKYLPYLLPGAVRYVRTDDIDNHHVLISDTSGPFFICDYK